MCGVGGLQQTDYGNGVTNGYDYSGRQQLRRSRAFFSVTPSALVANFDYDEAGDAPVAGYKVKRRSRRFGYIFLNRLVKVLIQFVDKNAQAG